MHTHVERLHRMNIVSNLVFLVLFLAITWNGIQGINDYKQRFNYLIDKVPCENCASIHTREEDMKAAIYIQKDLANMLRQNVNNSQILEKVKSNNADRSLYNSVSGNKSGIFVLNITLLLCFVLVFVKYLC